MVNYLKQPEGEALSTTYLNNRLAVPPIIDSRSQSVATHRTPGGSPCLATSWYCACAYTASAHIQFPKVRHSTSAFLCFNDNCDQISPKAVKARKIKFIKHIHSRHIPTSMSSVLALHQLAIKVSGDTTSCRLVNKPERLSCVNRPAVVTLVKAMLPRPGRYNGLDFELHPVLGQVASAFRSSIHESRPTAFRLLKFL
ncbi:hypothetical protein J6590_035957 [Homalodisca vitripennis]|nr:hypothetical protein J6590_035957 [Homalodisca vitripennis]